MFCVLYLRLCIFRLYGAIQILFYYRYYYYYQFIIIIIIKM